MPGMDVHLFGAPRIERGGVPVTVTRRKALALLAYLAVTRKPHTRAALIALFWPELDTGRARAALRRTLAALNRAIGKSLLSTEQDRIEFGTGPGLWVDVEQFRSLLATVEAHGHPSARLCNECVMTLTSATDLYQGDFLAGFSLGDAPEFDNWQTWQAEALRLELASALERLAQIHASRQDNDLAIRYARRWVGLDLLCEPAHRALMRYYAWSGDRTGVIRQYRDCAQALADELGAEPDPETRALYEQLQQTKPSAEGPGAGQAGPIGVTGIPTMSPPTLHNLPPEPTPFIGREVELAQIAGRLADPACRLLTVFGPAGIGKTRLAIQAARAQADRYAQGVYFVDLAPIASADLLSSTILRALPIASSSTSDPEAHLLHLLQDRHTLLVLDNFEHLLAGADLIPKMLTAAPRLKILVTSRARLNLREEWLVPLGGLEVPPPPGEDGRDSVGQTDSHAVGGIARDEKPASGIGPVQGLPSGLGSLESRRLAKAINPEQEAATSRAMREGRSWRLGPDLERYTASALFLGCVRRLQPDYHPIPQDVARIAQICQLLDGIPLGIELAAARAQTLPIAEIAHSLEQGLDLLTTTWRDMPPRHRSMASAFDHSWNLLSPQERSVLCQLSVFRGGFTSDAASEVAGASSADLENLVTASWLRLEPGGRYGMHELVRQYGAERQKSKHTEEAGGSSDQVRDRHATYYKAFVMARQVEYDRRPEAVREVALDYSNVLAAWDWFLEHDNLETIWMILGGLLIVTARLAWSHTALWICDTSMQMLSRQDVLAGDDADRRRQRRSVLSMLWMWKGHALLDVGMLARGEACYKEGMALLDEGDGGGEREAEARLWLRARMAWATFSGGDFSGATRAFQALWDDLQKIRFRLWPYTEDAVWYARAGVCRCLGLCAINLGRYEEARAWAKQSIALCEKVGSDLDKAYALNVLVYVLGIHDGDYRQVEKMQREMLRTVRAYDDKPTINGILLGLAITYAEMGRFDRARAYGRRSLALAKEFGDDGIYTTSLCTLGWAELGLGNAAESKRLYEESVARIGRQGDTSLVGRAFALQGLGRAVLALGDPAGAMRHFREALGSQQRTARDTAKIIEGIAQVLVREGRQEYAAEILAFVEAWPITEYVVRQAAQDLLQELEAGLTPEVFAAAVARGRGRQTDDVVAELSGM